MTPKTVTPKKKRQKKVIAITKEECERRVIAKKVSLTESLLAAQEMLETSTTDEDMIRTTQQPWYTEEKLKISAQLKKDRAMYAEQAMKEVVVKEEVVDAEEKMRTKRHGDYGEIDGSDVNKCVTVRVNGEPMALARPRFTPSGGGRFYNPSKPFQKEFKERARQALSSHIKFPYFNKNEFLKICIAFYMRRPAIHYNSYGRKRDNAPDLVKGRRVVDNMTKFVLEAMNGLLYTDDSQINTVVGVKMYLQDEYSIDNIPYTEIKIFQVDGSDAKRLLASF